MSKVREQFIRYLKLKGYSDVTVDHYVKNLALLSRHFNKCPLTISHDEVGAYLLHLREKKHLAPKTINLTLYSLRSFYGFFLPKSDVMAGYTRMKEPRKVPAVLSREEVERLIHCSSDLKTKAIITLMYSSGIRLAECAGLRIEDVDSKRMVLHIRRGKGGHSRFAVLSARALETLREYYRAYKPVSFLFENRRHTQPLLRRRIQQLVQETGIAAGIKKRVCPHILRHSFATHLIEDGKQLQAVQHFLGHTSIRTTVQYSHISAELLHSIGSPFDKPLPGEKKVT